MQELRFVAVSEDGSYAVLAVPGRSARFVLPIDEKLRAVALGQTSRLAQYEIEVESPLRPKEIQARIRAGETAEEIADAAGIPVERVRWFEGPVLAERAYIAQQAQTAVVRRHGDSAGPGPRLGDVVSERLSAVGTDPEEGQWDSRKRGDGSWQVQLTYSSAGRLHIAEWVFDPRRRHVMPEDDNAARLSLPESELPPEPETMPGEATVTPIASRLGAAAGMGNGPVPPAGGGRFRPERQPPERPERPGSRDRDRLERPATGDRRPSVERPSAVERPVAYAQPSGAPWRISPPPEFLDEPAADDGYRDEYADGYGGGYRNEAPPRDDRNHRDAQSYREERPHRPEPDFEYEPPPFEFEPVAPADAAPEATAPETAAPESPVPETAAPETPVLETPVLETTAAAMTVPETAAESPAAETAAEIPQAETPVAEPAPAEEFSGQAGSGEKELAESPAPEPAISVPAQATEAETPEAEASPTPGTEAAAAAPAAKTSKAPARSAAKPAAKSAAKSADANAPTVKAPAAKSPAGKPSAAAASVPDEPAAETVAAEEQGQEQAKRPRPAKKNPRNRRSSVPSWDEIMLGSSRQRE
jgi:hypothetical protein